MSLALMSVVVAGCDAAADPSAAGAASTFAQVSLPASDISAQATPPTPAEISLSSTLDQIYQEVRTAPYASRQALSDGFEQADRAIELAVSGWRSRGIEISTEGEEKLAAARESARQMFRQLSLATEATWSTARDNAASALRDLRAAVEQLPARSPGAEAGK